MDPQTMAGSSCIVYILLGMLVYHALLSILHRLNHFAHPWRTLPAHGAASHTCSHACCVGDRHDTTPGEPVAHNTDTTTDPAPPPPRDRMAVYNGLLNAIHAEYALLANHFNVLWAPVDYAEKMGLRFAYAVPAQGAPGPPAPDLFVPVVSMVAAGVQFPVQDPSPPVQGPSPPVQGPYPPQSPAVLPAPPPSPQRSVSRTSQYYNDGKSERSNDVPRVARWLAEAPAPAPPPVPVPNVPGPVSHTLHDLETSLMRNDEGVAHCDVEIGVLKRKIAMINRQKQYLTFQILDHEDEIKNKELGRELLGTKSARWGKRIKMRILG